MFDAYQTPVGSRYATTAGFLIVALIFSPAMLMVSRPLGYVSISLAIACSAACLAFAWVNFRRFAPVASATQRAAAK